MRFINCLLFCLLLASCSDENSAPNVVYYNGQIITVDKENSVQQAMAISDDKIVAVGDNNSIKALAGSNTQLVDLDNKTLMPAFVAVHEHPAISAVFKKFVDLSGFTHQSDKQVWQALKHAVANTPKGEWVYAKGLDPLLISDLKMPTKAFLDEMAPDHPVLIVSQSLHSFWTNSKGFEKRGIDKFTPDPGLGSFYEKDQKGELTGFISESAAAAPFLEDVKAPLNVLGNYESVLKELVENGFTSIASLGYNMPPLAAKWAGNYWTTPIIRQFFYMKEDEFKHLPDSPDNGDDFFRVLGVKLWHDGSPYTGTMYLAQPYLFNQTSKQLGITEGHRGESRISQKAFLAQLKTFHQQGWQIAVHSQGDASNKAVIDAFKEVIEKPNGLRHRIEHGLLLPEEELPNLAELGISPSFHINHIRYYGDALQNHILGRQRTQQLLAVNASVKHHLHPTLHADSPMFPADAFSLMQTAVSRLTTSGIKINPQQRVTVAEAIRMMTINGAWQLHLEDKLGSLEPNKYADFIQLSANPYTTDPAEWPNIDIEQVWMAGQPQR